MSEQNPYEPPSSDVTLEVSDTALAGRGARLGGALIDGLIMMLVIFPAMFLTGYWEEATAGEESVAMAMLLGLFGLAVFLLVNAYLLATSGQTVGKRLVGTRIVSVESNQILPLWKVVVARYLPVQVAGIVPIIGPILSLVDPLFIFREDRRCVHDLIAGTRVIVATRS